MNVVLKSKKITFVNILKISLCVIFFLTMNYIYINLHLVSLIILHAPKFRDSFFKDYIYI